MKARGKLLCIVCFCLAAAGLWGCFSTAKAGAGALPRGSLLLADPPISLSAAEISAAAEKGCFAGAALPVKTEDGQTLSATVAAPGTLGALGAAFASGTDFSGAPNEAVLDPGLAVALCGTQDAAGQTLTLDGQAYTVCGVLKDGEGFLSRRAQSGAPALYLSAPPSGTSAPLAVTWMYAASDTPLLESEAAAAAGAALGQPFAGSVLGLGDGAVLLRQVPKLSLLLAAAVPFLLLCIWVTREWARLAGPRRSVPRAAIGAAAFAGALFLLWLLLSAIDLPGSLLPPDLFFDGAHYRALFETFAASLSGPAGRVFPWRLLAVSGKWSAVWGILGAAFCWVGSGAAFAGLLQRIRRQECMAENDSAYSKCNESV